ncbi:uncharacterized protein LOC111045309 isoform X3 [Nilaparvata lugens]|uniref:uncharacterized protein LOC111045309 isoform X3 n=1 Tax=Nilaparvata lugens TaxID=108931 RepID=UPI00193CBB88|nr:uncharacterized protein LOC111045309 isoform X3 [Nilaparvata lugens]
MPSRDTPEQMESGAKPNRLGKFTKILDVFKEGDSAHCEAMRVLDDERIICILGSRASTREQYMKIYGLDLGDPLGEPYRPKMNEMVGVHWEENAPFWRRGLVLSELNDSYSVALVDSGFLVVSSNLRALPNDIKNIPLMSVKLCLTSSARVNVQQGDVLSVKLVKKLADSGEWEAEVYSTGNEAEHLGAGRFCEWNVEPDQVPELATLKLESGDEVIISSFHDISKIYVLPFSPQKAELYHSLSQEVAAEGIKAKRLGRDPAVGELVAAYWDQTCKHLRAQILEKVNAEGYYKVLFVDNGNIDEIHISKMKLLSHKLKTLRRCAVEVGLDGIEYKGLSPDAFNYLIQLAKLKELLKITFEDLKLVQLTKVSDNTDINKEIGKLFKPNKSQTHDTGTRQKQSDVFAMRTFPKRADLPEPDRDVILRIGETQKLMVPYVPPFKGVARDGRVEVVAFNANKKAITKYTLQLRKQMTDYIASQPTNRYVPRGGELCVCLQDEVPFRAECLKIFVNHARVRYVDYGNEVDVKFEQIFKMTNDLMQFPAYATYCYAEGIPANTTFEELKMVFDEIFEAKIKRFNDEHYTFYSPEIIARLTNKLK